MLMTLLFKVAEYYTVPRWKVMVSGSMSSLANLEISSDVNSLGSVFSIPSFWWQITKPNQSNKGQKQSTASPLSLSNPFKPTLKILILSCCFHTFLFMSVLRFGNISQHFPLLMPSLFSPAAYMTFCINTIIKTNAYRLQATYLFEKADCRQQE